MALLINRVDVPVAFTIRNGMARTWSAAEGWSWGYQVYDPETEILIEEGGRIPMDGAVEFDQTVTLKATLQLPAESGPYRVFFSAIHETEGWAYARNNPFAVMDIVIDHGKVTARDERITTLPELRRRILLRSAARAVVYPIRTVWRNRSLIRTMVRRDIVGRYRGSFAGIFWTLLNPLLLMVTYFFVFGLVLQSRYGSDQSRAGFALYLLSGMLPWMAFSEAAGRSPYIMLEHRNFVRKLVFAIETLPFNLVLAGLVSELFGVVLFVIGCGAIRGVVHTSVLWLPILLIPQILFTAGVCWFLAALGVFFRDLSQINGFLLTLWFFLTPICYPEESLPAWAVPILSKNPMFALVRAYRAILLDGHAPAFHSLWKLALVSILVFIAGHAWFYKLRRSFADVI